VTPEQDMVKQFHERFGLYIESDPFALIPKCERNIAIKLIAEEFDELKQGIQNCSLIEIADALGDLLYVVYGAANRYGIDMEPVFKEIHRSNMTKEGGYIQADGKFIKPDSYEPPDLVQILNDQIEKGIRKGE